MRGRILSCASSWIGSPFFWISIFTRAAPVSPGSASTSTTLPTSMPAMRTGDLGCTLFALLKVAVNVYGSANGL
jgi:hypothetical protein